MSPNPCRANISFRIGWAGSWGRVPAGGRRPKLTLPGAVLAGPGYCRERVEQAWINGRQDAEAWFLNHQEPFPVRAILGAKAAADFQDPAGLVRQRVCFVEAIWRPWDQDASCASHTRNPPSAIHGPKAIAVPPVSCRRWIRA